MKTTNVRNRFLLPFTVSTAVAVTAIAALAAVLLVSANERPLVSALAGSYAFEKERADHLSGEVAAFKDRESSLKSREASISSKEAAVKDREDAVSTTETQIASTTLRDGYVYTVGSTMEPGVYQANVTSGTCYWAIYLSGTNYSDIVDNDLGANGVLTVTLSVGQDFKSSRCGDWIKVG